MNIYKAPLLTSHVLFKWLEIKDFQVQIKGQSSFTHSTLPKIKNRMETVNDIQHYHNEGGKAIKTTPPTLYI